MKDYLDDINPLTYQGSALGMKPGDKRQAQWRAERDQYGFDHTYLWDMNFYLIKHIIPKLKMAVEYKHPLSIKTKEFYGKDTRANAVKSLKILAKIIEGFELYVRYQEFVMDASVDKKAVDKKIKKAFKLFRKHFNGLWN